MFVDEFETYKKMLDIRYEAKRPHIFSNLFRVYFSRFCFKAWTISIKLMCLHMSFNRTSLPKSFVANSTLEWFLIVADVSCFNVNLQICFCRVVFVAYLALERFSFEMSHQVDPEISFHCYSMSTEVTLESFHKQSTKNSGMTAVQLGNTFRWYTLLH